MKIAVFGGAAPQSGDLAYEEARQLGYLLGTSGHTLMTGGYIGVMEAVSKGAFEAGAHVIGSTCQEIETWRGTKANQWVKEEWKHATLRDRMYALIDACDAAIIMPGGVGTLAELAVLWNEEIISNKNSRPMILVGSAWKTCIEQFNQLFGTYVREKDQKRIQFAVDVQEAVNLISNLASHH